jgi:hypothetical protein
MVKYEEKRPLDGQGIDGRIILTWILKEWNRK